MSYKYKMMYKSFSTIDLGCFKYTKNRLIRLSILSPMYRHLETGISSTPGSKSLHLKKKKKTTISINVEKCALLPFSGANLMNFPVNAVYVRWGYVLSAI